MSTNEREAGMGLIDAAMLAGKMQLRYDDTVRAMGRDWFLTWTDWTRGLIANVAAAHPGVSELEIALDMIHQLRGWELSDDRTEQRLLLSAVHLIENPKEAVGCDG